jgi:acetyltransferase
MSVSESRAFQVESGAAAGGPGGTVRLRAHPLDPVLRPASVAVVGASTDPTKRGHRAVRALRTAGYRGRIIPVHPRGGELLGFDVARGPADLAEPADLVLVCTPAATVPAVLEEWAAAGTRGAVVLAAGFRESGDDGARLEDGIRGVAARTGIRVMGPNTSGLLNVSLGLNLIGVEGVLPGPVSLLVQSGNVALALMTEAEAAGAGFSFVIGVGNEADIGFHEYLDFLVDDPRTRAILIHAEGFRDGGAFLAAAKRAAATKPVAMIKGARTDRGTATARSHTGAVAGRYAVLRSALRQAGIVEVDRTDELLPVVTTLVGQPPVPAGSGLAILSDGGGHATIAVDDLHARGVPLASLEVSTIDGLRTLLGTAAAVTNPVDLAGAADRDPLVFARALEILAADPAVAGVLVVGLFGGYAIRFAESLLGAEMEAAKQLPVIARRAGIALVVHSLYADTHGEPLRILQRAEVPVLGSLEVACRCIAATVERGQAVERLDRLPAEWPAATRVLATEPPRGAPADPFGAARGEGRSVLLETESRSLTEACGVPLVAAQFCRTTAEATAAARRSGGDVAIRVVSPSAPHKTDAGGVALNVAPAEASRVAERLCDAVRRWCAARRVEGDIRGVLISPMLPRPVAELLVGIVRDPQLGPMLTVGAGGTDVELQRDVAMRVLPVTADDVVEMLAELRIAGALAGHRGGRGADAQAIVRAVLGLAHCALAYPEIGEIEVNPLFAYEDRVVGVDVRIFLG